MATTRKKAPAARRTTAASARRGPRVPKATRTGGNGGDGNTGASPARITLARTAKGKKPQYFSDPATDKLLWMTLTLMEELSVTRDRLDTLERLLAQRRVLGRDEIDGWRADAAAEAERASRRSAYVARVLRAVHAELEELTARGAAPEDALRAVEA